MEQPNFSYYNTVDQIYHVEWSTQKLVRLELVRESIRTLWPNGHPTRLIHVAGTSGKGSTCRFLEMGLSALGKAGAFMSPHLFDYRERFSINGEFVRQADVAWAWETRVQPHCVRLALHNPHHTHTFHEASILIALALFERHGVEWAAMEAGVGGRYDQTRALDVVATVLTNVGSDHAHMLGHEQWQRVLDKAGIARPGVPFFTSDTNPANLEIMAVVCRDVAAPLYQINEIQVAELEEQVRRIFDPPLVAESLLSAGYQKWNASLALTVIRHLCPQLEERQVLQKFADARLVGRLWQVETQVYADIAHNAEKITALTSEIETRFAGLGKILVVGLSGPRVPRQVFAALAKVAKAIVVTGASYKGQDPAKVQREIAALTGDTPTLLVAEPAAAYQVARSMQGAEDIIIVTGSTYTIEQIFNPDSYLRTLSATFGWRTKVDTEASGTVQLTLPKPPPLIR